MIVLTKLKDREWKSKRFLHHINLYFDLILRSSDKLENGENINFSVRIIYLQIMFRGNVNLHPCFDKVWSFFVEMKGKQCIPA